MDLFVTTDSEGVYMGMNETPSGERIHIGFFGRRNAGKSSLVNAVTGQDLSIVSEVRGTTTDPVSKSMELLPCRKKPPGTEQDRSRDPGRGCNDRNRQLGN